MNDVRARIALLLSITALGGCAVGSAYVSAPDRLASNILPPLAYPIRFAVCNMPGHESRNELEDRVEKVLSHAGVTAVRSLGASPVDFTVTVREHFAPGWSAVVSAMTFSIVPGYFAEQKTLDVELAWRDAGQRDEMEHLHYESRTNAVIWLPLIVSMDFFMSTGGGWASSKVEDGGLKPMIERLGDDIRVRLGRDGAARSDGDGAVCPPAALSARDRDPIRGRAQPAVSR
jgi:hypothetical protein